MIRRSDGFSGVYQVGNYFEDLYYVKGGNGPPLIALHGFGETSYSWRHLAPFLEEKHTVYLFDLRGHGGSMPCIEGRFSLQAQSNTICKFIFEQDLRDLTLLGHSMGGGIALLTALFMYSNSQHRLNAMILVDSVGIPQKLPLSFRAMRISPLVRCIFRLLSSEFIMRLILNEAFFDKTKISPSAISTYAANLARADGIDVLVSTAQQMVPPNIMDLISPLQDVDLPTLVISGKQDKIVPPSVAIGLNALLGNSQLVVIDHCGHIPHEERPELTKEIINDFLLGLERRAWKP